MEAIPGRIQSRKDHEDAILVGVRGCRVLGLRGLGGVGSMA